MKDKYILLSIINNTEYVLLVNNIKNKRTIYISRYLKYNFLCKYTSRLIDNTF